MNCSNRANRAPVCFVGRTVLDKLIERTPSLLHNFLATTSTALNMSDVVLAQTIHLNVRARLAIFLLRLRDRHGQVDDDGKPLPRSQTVHLHSDHEGGLESKAWEAWREKALVHDSKSPPHDHDPNGKCVEAL